MSLLPENHNFIQAELCDNDFGYDLVQGLEEGVAEYGYHEKLCPILWKKFLIAFIVGKALKSWIEDSTGESLAWDEAKRIEGYLRDSLRVTFERTAPTDDHDGGSACIDLHTGTAWAY